MFQTYCIGEALEQDQWGTMIGKHEQRKLLSGLKDPLGGKDPSKVGGVVLGAQAIIPIVPVFICDMLIGGLWGSG